ncbi:substrate-binding domain-containing protein [Streptomyces sp. 6N106]|uniref:substrate-binding domain-containing protein n=1 Tax=Streptomyces sp. 6N106 TaxID=3457418 RepID=UPI003FD2E8C8
MGRHAGSRPRSVPAAGGRLHRARRSRRHGRTAGEPPDVDGVFAVNDNMGAGALRPLREPGRLVPADVAVVGFGDLAVAQIADPPLTTAHQSMAASAGRRRACSSHSSADRAPPR